MIFAGAGASTEVTNFVTAFEAVAHSPGDGERCGRDGHEIQFQARVRARHVRLYPA